MHDQLAESAARVVEPKRRKVRKTVAPPVSNSVVELVAGRYLKAVNRIWGTKVGEYLSAPDARRHLWHACFASGHPSFRWQTAARNALVRPAHIRAGQGAGCTSLW